MISISKLQSNCDDRNDTYLGFLDLLLNLSNQSLLFLKLGIQGSNFLLLLSEVSFQFLLVLLQISNSFLGEFQVGLDLSLVLIDISSKFLLSFKGVFQFIKGLFKFGLYFVQVINFVLSCLKVFGGLLSSFLECLLLFVEFLDDFVLMRDLVIEVSDLVIFGCLVLLSLDTPKN